MGKKCTSCNGLDNSSQNNKECFESRFSSDYTQHKLVKVRGTNKSKSECCSEIDLSKVEKTIEWVNGDCIIDSSTNRRTGYIYYNDLKVSSKEKEDIYTPREEVTPLKLSLLAKITLKEAIDILDIRTVKSSECKNEFCNDEITASFAVQCPPGKTAEPVIYTLPACTVVSSISKNHANQLAQQKHFILGKKEADCVVCQDPVLYCNTEITDSVIKTNCPLGSKGLEVPFTVEAGKFCSQQSQEKANEQAQSFLDRMLERNALTADSCTFCEEALVKCNTELQETITKVCPDENKTRVYTVKAGKYCVVVTDTKDELTAQNEADQKAQDEIARVSPNILASLQCDSVINCPEPVFVGNLRNNKTSPLANTWNNPLIYEVTWNQNFIDTFESTPATQVFKKGVNGFALKVYKNNNLIIDTSTYVNDDYFSITFFPSLNDVIRYEATFDSTFGEQYIYEATRLKGCPIPNEEEVTLNFTE